MYLDYTYNYLSQISVFVYTLAIFVLITLKCLYDIDCWYVQWYIIERYSYCQARGTLSLKLGKGSHQSSRRLPVLRTRLTVFHLVWQVKENRLPRTCCRTLVNVPKLPNYGILSGKWSYDDIRTSQRLGVTNVKWKMFSECFANSVWHNKKVFCIYWFLQWI